MEEKESSKKRSWVSKDHIIFTFKLVVVTASTWVLSLGYPIRWLFDSLNFLASFGGNNDPKYSKKISEELVRIEFHAPTVQESLFLALILLVLLALTFIPTSSGKKKDNNDA